MVSGMVVVVLELYSGHRTGYERSLLTHAASTKRAPLYLELGFLPWLIGVTNYTAKVRNK